MLKALKYFWYHQFENTFCALLWFDFNFFHQEIFEKCSAYDTDDTTNGNVTYITLNIVEKENVTETFTKGNISIKKIKQNSINSE